MPAQAIHVCGAWLSDQLDAPELDPGSLEDSIRSLLAQGKKITAIKRYREQTGAGLAAAKHAVERLERGESFAADAAAANDPDQQILELLAAGKKIAAIKIYREQMQAGLKEAKEAVEAIAAEHGIVPPPRSGCFAVLVLLLSAASLILSGLLRRC